LWLEGIDLKAVARARKDDAARKAAQDVLSTLRKSIDEHQVKLATLQAQARLQQERIVNKATAARKIQRLWLGFVFDLGKVVFWIAVSVAVLVEACEHWDQISAELDKP